VKIALDAQLAVGTATGIGVYQRDLARALGEAHQQLHCLGLELDCVPGPTNLVQRRVHAWRIMPHTTTRTHTTTTNIPARKWYG